MTDIPRIPSIPHPVTRRLWGLLHELLSRLSESYCSWFNIPFAPPIMQLPFGLILKWSDRTRIEEVVAMQVARAAGMPVPLVLCYGEHPSDPIRPISILMTRLPGWPLFNSRNPFIEEEQQPWFDELRDCVHAMRKWKNPLGDNLICSITQTPITTHRVPGHAMGPFHSERELHDYLLSPASSHGFKTMEEYEAAMAQAKQILDIPHRMVFTHGDLKTHNILVDENYCLSGFLDWETAGWYPEYWEYTTAMKYCKGTWWYEAMLVLGADQYTTEVECERALNNLTVDSWAG